MSKTDYLKSKIDHFVHDYEKKRRTIKWRTESMRTAAIFLAGLTTVLVGLREFDVMSGYSQALGIAALVVSALASMATAWESFAGYGWRWVHYRVNLIKFRMLKDRLEYALAEKDSLDDAAQDRFFAEIEAIVEEANDQWLDHRAKSINQS
ncbi:MAG: DUF4231 domain-containing protein [Pseudomonadota bacterium]